MIQKSAILIYLVLSATDRAKAVRELNQHVRETTSEVSEQDVVGCATGGCHHCNMLLIVWNIKDVVIISLDGKALLGARFIRRYFLCVQQRNERLYHPSRGTVGSLIKPNTVSSLNNPPPPPHPKAVYSFLTLFYRS